MEIQIRRGADKYGPYSLAEVRTYLGDGRLEAQDFASTDGGLRWLPLSELLAERARDERAEPAWGTDSRTAPPLVAPGFGTTAVHAYSPGGRWARFGAYILDSLVCLAFLIPGAVAYVATESEMTPIAAVLLGLGALAAIVYGFVKDGLGEGRSLGKQAVGLMVVHLPSNRPCSTGQSAVRSLIMGLTNFLPYVGWLIEPIMVLAASDGRRLGDRAAGTQVISVADYRA